jgi:glycosyltransferase involved in cell wall biosynthesis
MNMRLLLFNLATDIDDPVLGFTTRWIWALAKRVEFIHVLTMRTGRIEVPENVRVYSLGKEKGYSEPRRATQFYRHLFRIVRGDKIDVCFSHMIPLLTVLAAPVLKLHGIPIVTWYAHPTLTRILRVAHYLSDRLVTSLATAYPYTHDKLTIVGQGVDTDLFSLDARIAPESPPLILCVGRLSPVKDHPTLLKAIWLLQQKWSKPVQVVILGGPASPQDTFYMQSLHEQVKELRLEKTVAFRPPVPMMNLPDWYRRCSVLVNMTPSGSGDKVAWEAMACGRPCIVANEGYKETLGRYTADCLFPYGDWKVLAAKLLGILSMTSTDRLQIGDYLRHQVVDRHSLKRLTEKFVLLFEALQEN